MVCHRSNYTCRYLCCAGDQRSDPSAKNIITTDSTPDAPLLDRNLYRTIKKMDRDTLQGLIQNIFEQGRQKGLSDAGVSEINDNDHTLDLRELEKLIRSVPGMGEKRTEAVMQIIEQWMGV